MQSLPEVLESAMYIYLFFLLAAALAIPTYGASLLGFFLLKRLYDNRAVSAILAQAVISMRQELTTELFRVNRAAIQKLFARFCIEGTADGIYVGGISIRWGVFSHPMIEGGKQFSLRVICQPRGAVDIKAAPGIDHEILSERLPGIGSFRLAALGALAEQELNRKG